MINENIHFLISVKGKVLDDYLSQGWYRIRDLMFTTDHIVLDERVIPVQWIRYDLAKLVYSRSARKLLNRNLRLFEVNIQPAQITAEHEELFTKYRSYVDLEISESVKETLFTQEPFPIFDTQLIEIRKESRLVGVGYFDLGSSPPSSPKGVLRTGSAAGILNFYDPDYRKYSLGKWLMLLAIEYVKNSGRRYFYPGYVAEGSVRRSEGLPLETPLEGKFDYKVNVGERGVERFIADNWI